MPKAILTPDRDDIIAEIEISAPPSRIFEALTDPAQLIRWFDDLSCPVEFWQMDARPGGSYRYETKKGPYAVNGINVFKTRGEIIEIDPPRLLVYTWFANWHQDQGRKTIVRWDLTPTEFGTHVKVTHSGLAQEPEASADYRGGWAGVVKKLKQFVEMGMA